MALFRLKTLIKPASAFTKPRSIPSLYASVSHYSAESPPAPEAGKYPGLGPTKPNEKPRLVVLGTGWAGSRLMKDIDTKLYDVVCVSPRNHMVFTPLLTSNCVGTQEFRSVAEPIGRIQPSFSTDPGSFFFLPNCKGLDPDDHVLHCETHMDGAKGLKPWKFKISHDKLVIASGAQASMFGIHGLQEHAIFLREEAPLKLDVVRCTWHLGGETSAFALCCCWRWFNWS